MSISRNTQAALDDLTEMTSALNQQVITRSTLAVGVEILELAANNHGVFQNSEERQLIVEGCASLVAAANANYQKHRFEKDTDLSFFLEVKKLNKAFHIFQQIFSDLKPEAMVDAVVSNVKAYQDAAVEKKLECAQKLSDSVDELINAFYEKTQCFVTASRSKIVSVQSYVKRQIELVNGTFLLMDSSKAEVYKAKLARCQSEIEKAAEAQLKELTKQKSTTAKIARFIEITSQEVKVEKAMVKKGEAPQVYTSPVVAELVNLGISRPAANPKVSEGTKLDPKGTTRSYGSFT